MTFCMFFLTLVGIRGLLLSPAANCFCSRIPFITTCVERDGGVWELCADIHDMQL